MWQHELRTLVSIFVAVGLVACGGGGGGDNAVSNPVVNAPNTLAAGMFTKTIDMGTDATYYKIADANDYLRRQILYKPLDINGSGRITGVAFKYQNKVYNAVTCSDVSIRLSHSNLADLTTNFVNNLGTGQGQQTSVLTNAAVTFPAGVAGTWQLIQFATPFDINGVDNLIVEIERVGPCSGSVGVESPPWGHIATVDTSTSGQVTGYNYYRASNVRFTFAGGTTDVIAQDKTNAGFNYGVAPAKTGRTQFVLRAADIAGSGPVTGIQFKAATALTAATGATYSVTLSHIANPLSTTFADNLGADATPVAKDVAVNLPVGTTEFWIPFTGQFTYDGTSDLLVDVTANVSNSFFVLAYGVPVASERLIYIADPASTTGFVVANALQATLRFHGAPAMVMPTGGTAGTVTIPLGGNHTDGGKHQALYRNDLLGTGGTIRNIYVRLAQPSSAVTLANYKLYMGHTTNTSYDVNNTFASNMEENATVYSGSLEVPGSLLQGDWVKIPLATPFVYDPAKNLSILFTTDAGKVGENAIQATADASRFLNAGVYRNDNFAASDTPTLPWSAIPHLKIDLDK